MAAMTKTGPSVVLLGLAFWSCSSDDSPPPAAAAPDTTAVVAEWTEPRLSSTEIDSARYEATWRIAPSVDSLIAGDSLARQRLPGDSILIRATSVLDAQILLDRSPFKPGVIDGKWGKNTEKAVFWLQHQAGLPATGQIDSATYRKLVELAGAPDQYVRTVALTAEDVAGPFQPLPEDVYEKANLECLCYESLPEKLSERFHVTPDVLAQLNQGVSLDSLVAGDSLRVPNLEAAGADTTAGTPIARVVVSDQGRYLHALDSTGTILYHFPTTLGSTFSPSPEGRLQVTRITRNPWFHWQPRLLEGVPDTKKPARLPPGPNSPVGVVWIALSREHFGIHGTNEPATIGYATSSGCVRLTNWDARFLAGLVGPGTTVEFRDLGPRAVAQN
jgi:lipoprotein-anchoring transpeptidase ErfK/SrfK